MVSLSTRDSLTRIVNYKGSVVSCAKTAEPIEMQFGTLRRVGPGNIITWEMEGNGQFCGVWPIVKHCNAEDLGWIKGEL